MNYYIEKINGNIYLTGEMDDEKIALTRRSIKSFSLEPHALKCYMEEGLPMKIGLSILDKVYINKKKAHG